MIPIGGVVVMAHTDLEGDVFLSNNRLRVLELAEINNFCSSSQVSAEIIQHSQKRYSGVLLCRSSYGSTSS